MITGAASGIGRATVLRFIEEGAKVLAIDRPATDLSGLAGAVTGHEDVTAPHAAEHLAELAKIEGSAGRLAHRLELGAYLMLQEDP